MNFNELVDKTETLYVGETDKMMKRIMGEVYNSLYYQMDSYGELPVEAVLLHKMEEVLQTLNKLSEKEFKFKLSSD